jgi:hypothetical protein
MTNWQDKYKDLEVGQVAWYWHKENRVRYPRWEAVRVERRSYDCSILLSRSIFSDELLSVSEDFPNGPRCIMPDEEMNND